MKSVTLKDVAKAAGVSYATVSRALSGSHQIGSDTRERIIKLCDEMGYTTNYVARSMVTKRTGLIGLVVPSIDNQFMSELAYYAEMSARGHGYNIMLCNSGPDLKQEKTVVKLLLSRQVDGILIVPQSPKTYENIRAYTDQVPTVFLSENLRDQPQSYVAVDNSRGTYIGTKYLYDLGHRDILYFGRRHTATHQLRAEGYWFVTVEELLPINKITGVTNMFHKGMGHNLNTRAAALRYAKEQGRDYKEITVIVAHLGGGISVSAHSHGRIIDSVSDDAGPFSPDRGGSLNMLYVLDMCYSGKYTKAEMTKKLRGEGGMSALLGTHDCQEVERRIAQGDEWAALVYQAQALQIAKGVGTMLACFTSLIDAVILTGGLANSKMLTGKVIDYLHNLCRVVVIPGENEMEALALGGLRILRGEEEVHEFHPVCPVAQGRP